jgi:hypothetical protein
LSSIRPAKPSPRPGCWRRRRSAAQSMIRAAQDRLLPPGDPGSDSYLESAVPATCPGRVRRALQPASTTPDASTRQPAERPP